MNNKVGVKMIHYKLHHIGCAVTSIEAAKDYYINYFGYKQCFQIQSDNDNLHALFLKKDGIYLELLKKIDKEKISPIDKILSVLGGGVYHECYQVENIEEAVIFLTEHNFIKMKKKVSVYEFFKTIYLITPDNHVVELLEELK